MKWVPSGGKLPYDDCTTLAISYLTDREKLLPFVPEEFAITQPLIMITYEKCNAVQWMGGSTYSLITVSVPVRYLGSEEPIDGVYHLVIWEDKAFPIYGGREEAGMPKIFADIPEYRWRENNFSANVSHEGRTFLEMDLVYERACSPGEIAEINENNGRVVQFGWRYIPKVGPFTGAALSEATYYPVDNEYVSGSVCSGEIKWTVPKLEQHPMQYGIIAALSSLPVLKYNPGSFKKGKSWMRMDLAHSLP
ncbi:MAG: acetoacetate decarboxylase family protein [Methanoregula sp.]|nr:acetoacetate decarboxylase family protein [Methanoregula sp.]